MKRLLVLGLLAACGPRPAATSTVPANGGGTPAGPPYAALFESGRSWTFDIKFHDSFWDDQDPAADADGNVNTDSTAQATCKVNGVDEIDGGKVSHIECTTTGESDISQLPLDGDWFADGATLYKGSGEYKEMVMAAVPVERSNDQEGEEGSMHDELARKGDAWCWASSSAMGDESWESVCFGPDGVTEGTWGWAGGSVHESTFTVKAN